VARTRTLFVLIAVAAWLLAAPPARPAVHAQSAAPAPSQAPAAQGKPLRLAIAGLVHGHVGGFLNNAKKRTDVEIVGVFEPDTDVLHRYAQRFGFADNILFTDLAKMLDQTKPDAVSSFTDTFDHPMVVEAAAQRHLTVMMEKPLAVSMEHARRIQKAAAAGHIEVVVNYETSWYPSHGAIWNLAHEQHALGDIRKMVAMDGHEGPKEINVQPEFLNWLTDPVKNGAGALFDFGCYGANLMTWLMNNERPRTVTAITARNKPQIYAKVDDEATILVQYPKAQGIIQASWNWPFGRKDFEVYGEHGLAIATGGNNLRVRLPKEEEKTSTPEPLSPDQHDSLAYLSAVARGVHKSTGLSSLENNVIVTEILESARESARTGKTITLSAAK
jgi:predicted dehydrogenase